jgi:L-ascorbate oxidase
MQRTAGLYGSIIVQLPDSQNEPFYYDDEASVLLSDWWHKSMYEQQLGLDSIPFRFVGEPQVSIQKSSGPMFRFFFFFFFFLDCFVPEG